MTFTPKLLGTFIKLLGMNCRESMAVLEGNKVLCSGAKSHLRSV